MSQFKVVSQYQPAGDQPKAITQLSENIQAGKKFQTLLGVTGSGKTFTIAKVIEKVQKPTLVIAHNKTLAAQLASEFRQFFPHNAVEYFVSYYDYYQPEAYLPSTDTYIEKDLEINDEIDRLRHAATAALLSRQDVIVVASVSCIYGLGTPEYYASTTIQVTKGEKLVRKDFIKKLVEMQFQRSDVLERAKFRVKGEVFEIMRPDREIIIRIELDNDVVKRIVEYDFLTGEILNTDLKQEFIFPAKHFVVPEPLMKDALVKIRQELDERVNFFRQEGKILEMERIKLRTRHDLELMEELGYCNGIENYSVYLSGRQPGQAPYTLMDYFPDDFLVVIDESHVTIPQLHAMYGGDRSRKNNLIEHGFRLPSAYDNRPLKFGEFEQKMQQAIFVSATPSQYEVEKSVELSSSQKVADKDKTANKTAVAGIVEQIVRPTGLIDPEIIVRPCLEQVKDVIEEIAGVVKHDERVLITTLTKKMAEDLAEYLKEAGVKAEYLHSNIDTIDRIRILEDLRRGTIEVLVGVNLLREGLDLPEVSLVAILDADKEGFLRSETSLIQTIGRAARNVKGRVILYADNITGSMKRAIDETERRRKLQKKYNQEHGITPKTVQKNIKSIVDFEINPSQEAVTKEFMKLESLEDLPGYIKQREREMKEAAKRLEFEKAAIIRDEIGKLRKLQLKK